ncbi:MAG: transposase [Erysipelotrichaceae bacterium]|nr:transposase [Erysipelotrichaceae bacterium]
MIHRQKRSIYAEGVFGVLKQYYGYVGLHRRGIEKTELELTLVIIGFNLNKYHNKLNRPGQSPA